MAWQWFPSHPAWQWNASPWQAADWSHANATQWWSAAQWSAAHWDADAAALVPSSVAEQSSATAADRTGDDAAMPRRVYNAKQQEWAHLSCIVFTLTVRLWFAVCGLHVALILLFLPLDFFICCRRAHGLSESDFIKVPWPNAWSSFSRESLQMLQEMATARGMTMKLRVRKGGAKLILGGKCADTTQDFLSTCLREAERVQDMSKARGAAFQSKVEIFNVMIFSYVNCKDLFFLFVVFCPK